MWIYEIHMLSSKSKFIHSVVNEYQTITTDRIFDCLHNDIIAEHKELIISLAYNVCY